MLELAQSAIFHDVMIPHLSVLELHNLSKTCTTLLVYKSKYHTNKIIIDKINKKLLSYFDDNPSLVKRFKELMKKTCSVISGSFLIQCILNIEWYCDNSITDLDIYIPIVGNVIKVPFKNAYPKSEMDDFMYYAIGHDGYGYNPEYHGITTEKIEFVNNYNNRTQITGIKTNKNIEAIQNFIDTTFDLDVCKNMYYVDENGEHIRVSSLENILTKSANLVIDDYQFIKHDRYIINRCKKYERRGFKIQNLPAKKQSILSKILENGNIYSHDCDNYDNWYVCKDLGCCIVFLDPNLKHCHNPESPI